MTIILLKKLLFFIIKNCGRTLFFKNNILIFLLLIPGMLDYTQAGERDNLMKKSFECEQKFESLEDILADLKKNGQVQVIIAIDIPFRPEGELNAEEVKDQRKSIALAQDKLVEQLGLSMDFALEKMKTLPFLVLTITEKELRFLDCHPMVRSVGYNKTVQIKDRIDGCR